MNKFTLAFLIVLFTSVMIRLYLLDQPLLEFFPERQTQTAEITRNIYQNGWVDFLTPKVRYFTGHPIALVEEFPIYNGLLALIYRYIHPAVIWGRILSIIFFTLSAVVLYRLITKLSNKNLALYSLVFYLFSPIGILVSRMYQPESAVLFFLLVAVYLSSWPLFAIAVLLKLHSLFFLPVLFYMDIKRGNPGRTIIQAAASLILPVLWYARAKTLNTHPAVSGFSDIFNWFQPHLLLTPEWYIRVFQIESVWVLTPIGLLLLWIGIWFVSSKIIKPLSIWLACCVFFSITFTFTIMTHEYYHFLFLPPLSIIIGIAIEKIVHLFGNFSTVKKFVFIWGILFMFATSLTIPAINKIKKAPKTVKSDAEFSTTRYQMIEDF